MFLFQKKEEKTNYWKIVGITLGIISLVLALLVGIFLGIVYSIGILSEPVGGFYYEHHYF